MKKYLKTSAAVFLALCAAASAACAGNDQQPASSEAPTAQTSADEVSSLTYPVTVKVGYSTSEDDPRGIVLKKFKETVEAETNGDVLIEIHPGGELGSDAQLIDGIIHGTVDMTVSSAGNYSSYATKIGASALPFLFSDFESAWAFIDSDKQKEISADLEGFNIHALAYFDNGFRCVTTTNKPINSIDDMEGLNIRTPQNPIINETMRRLKAEPKEYDFAKLRDALTDGTFDAQENPIPVIYNNKLYEVQKYLAITNHSYDAMPLTIRNDLWTQLKPEYRDIIENAAKVAATEDRQMIKQQTEDLVSKLEEEGMTVTYPDLAPFKAATAGIVDEVYGKIYDEELINIIKNL